MIWFNNKRRIQAQSIAEYMLVVGLVLSAIVLMQKYVLRGLMGKYKSSADQLDYGRQYDPKKTVACLYFGDGKNGIWLPEDCVRAQGGSAFACDPSCRAACGSGEFFDLCNK